MIDQKHVVVGIEDQAGHAVELAIGIALGSPGSGHVTVPVIDSDSLQKIVAQVQVVFGIQRQRRRPHHVSRGMTIRADLAEELVVGVSHLDAHDVERVTMAAAGYKHSAVAADREVRGQVEAATALVSDEADGRYRLKSEGCRGHVKTLRYGLL